MSESSYLWPVNIYVWIMDHTTFSVSPIGHLPCPPTTVTNQVVQAKTLPSFYTWRKIMN